MALPYPEGEVFFKRSVLKNNGNGLNPDSLASFNSHALIEWCWNETPASGSYSRNGINHRVGEKNSKEEFAFHDAMIVIFGTKEGFENRVSNKMGHSSRHSGIEVMTKTMLPLDTDEYEKRAKGGPLKTAVTPIKLYPGLPYMYIDLVFPIRAIYFPLARKPSSVFPDLCSYLMVDFRLRQGVKMYDSPPTLDVLRHLSTPLNLDCVPSIPMEARIVLDSNGFNLENMTAETKEKAQKYWEIFTKKQRANIEITMNFDLNSGLGQHPDNLISLYIPGVYNYLILPRQLRSIERGLYMPTDPKKSLIRIHDKNSIDKRSTLLEYDTKKQKLSLKLDMTKILEGHLGVQVVWQPFDIPEPEDANQMMIDLVEAGLCFVPVVGPLASNCFGLFMDIVNNPDAFKEANPLRWMVICLLTQRLQRRPSPMVCPSTARQERSLGFLGRLEVRLPRSPNRVRLGRYCSQSHPDLKKLRVFSYNPRATSYVLRRSGQSCCPASVGARHLYGVLQKATTKLLAPEL